MMNRREAMAGLVSILGVTQIAPAPASTYGYMDIDRWFKDWHFGKRVLVDGRDVTDDCVWFDDRKGEVCCMSNPRRMSASYDGLVKEIVHGRLTIVEGKTS